MLAEQRLVEATTLLDAGHWDGAYYLGGYVIECALKACIAKKTREHDFHDKSLVDKSYTHNLSQLLGVAGLTIPFNDRARDQPAFDKNWKTIVGWSEYARYQRHEEQTSKAFLDAIANDSNGVFPWLKTHW